MVVKNEITELLEADGWKRITVFGHATNTFSKTFIPKFDIGGGIKEAVAVVSDARPNLSFCFGSQGRNILAVYSVFEFPGVEQIEKVLAEVERVINSAYGMPDY